MFALCCSSCCTCCCTYSCFFFLLMWLLWLVLFFFRFLFHVFSPCGCLACCCCWSSCSSCSCCSCFIVVFVVRVLVVLLLFLVAVGIVGIIVVASCCFFLLVVVVVAGGGGGGGAVAAGVLTLSYQISHPWWLLLFWFCWDNVCKARIWIEHSVLCYALLFNLMAFQSQVFFQLINSGLSNVIELSLTITSSIGFQHAISLPLCFLVYKRSTWNENTGLPPLLNADSSNFPELKPLVLEVPVDVACTCVRICSKTKQTIYKVR